MGRWYHRLRLGSPVFSGVFFSNCSTPKKNTSQNKMRGQNAKRLGMQLKLTFAKTEEKYNIYIYKCEKMQNHCGKKQNTNNC